MDSRISVICALLLCCVIGGISGQLLDGFLDRFRYRADGSCPKVKAQSTFDQDSYYGRWYEIVRYPVPYEFGQGCVTADYSAHLLRQGDVKVINTGVFNSPRPGQLKRKVGIHGWATVPDQAKPAELQVNFAAFGDSGDESNYWVLDTNYANYTCVHSCVQGSGFHTMANWILTRTPNPSNETMEEALQVFKEASIPLRPFVETDRSDCPDAYYEDAPPTLLERINISGLIDAILGGGPPPAPAPELL